MIAAIERLLGHPLPPAHAACDLNALPAAVLADARRLGRFQRRAYLHHVVAPSEHRWIDGFIADCLAGEAAPATWRRGRIVALTADAPGLLTASVDAVLAPLAALGTLVTLAPDPTRRFMQGAPAVAVPDATYRWDAPAGTIDYAWGIVETRPVADAALALRRWLTTMLHFWAADAALPATPEAVLGQLRPAVSQPSAHAIAAARALLALRALHPEAAALGLHGDDALFGLTGQAD